MSEGLGIIAKFLYIIAVIVVAHGGWQVHSGNADMGKSPTSATGSSAWPLSSPMRSLAPMVA
jgi:TRAP-type C4-dicarboxylate transport system permease small subunit